MLVFIRHSHSISNEMRDLDEPGSQDVRDPGLSKKGVQEARAYGPQLRKLLTKHGIDLKTATFASSPLRRARQTLGLLFPHKSAKVLPQFGENGNIPENTPAGQQYQKPSLNHVLDQVKSLGDTIIVGHGSFLTSTVWPTLAGTQHRKFHNLDAFIVTPEGVTDISKLSGYSRMRATRRLRKNKQRRQKTRKTRQRKQRGGGLPLAYFSPGATQGYDHAPSGRGLESSNSTWVRTALNSTQ
jgi:broad specificity phosphatase PhoE